MNSFRTALYQKLKGIVDDPSRRYPGVAKQTPQEVRLQGEKKWPLAAAETDFAAFTKSWSGLIEDHAARRGPLYGLLNDEESRKTLLDVTAYSILGPEFVRFMDETTVMDMAAAYHFKAVSSPEELTVKAPISGTDFYIIYHLNEYDIAKLFPGAECKVVCQARTLLNYRMRRQYEYHGDNASILVESGDIVMDCGAAFGDDAVFFARAAGPDGMVLAYEPYPDFFKIAEMNAGLNASLKDRISVVPKAVSGKAGAELDFRVGGETSGLTADRGSSSVPGRIKVTATSIDYEVAQKNLPRVDFIKMDIEGAELEALRGAERTLKKCAPKLAVSVYHLHDDYMTIPEYINGLNLGYKFHLGRQSFDDSDIILFAAAR